MSTPKESLPEQPKESESRALSLLAHTERIEHSIQTLLEGEKISPADRWRLEAAKRFLAAPTEDIIDIAYNAENVGEVCGGYYQEGQDPPAEIEELNKHFQRLLCEHHLHNAMRELNAVPQNSERIRKLVLIAFNFGDGFAKGFKDDIYRKQAVELQRKSEAL